MRVHAFFRILPSMSVPLTPELSPDRLRSLLGGPRRDDSAGEGLRRAAVLVPVVMTDAGPHLLFTKRTESVETHKGQISFPGGTMDSTDASEVDTALREFEEELGVSGMTVDILGRLDDVSTPSGFLITPVVGMVSPPPSLRPNPEEVAEVFMIPLNLFFNPESWRVERRQRQGQYRDVWFFDAGKHTVWGATALMVRDLVRRLDPGSA